VDAVKQSTFIAISVTAAAAVYATARLIGNDYYFYTGYVILQFIVLSTAWNILGGYCGYVNFGSTGFFAVGVYTTVFFYKLQRPMPLPILILLAGASAGLLGLCTGYLTLRLRGYFFAIATLALAEVVQTLVVNFHYVGGSGGAYIVGPTELDIGDFRLPYVQYLFLLMLMLAAVAVIVSRAIERSRLGDGFATIRDDETAAEACGVPTFKLKLLATMLSGGIMGMAGATFPYYLGYIEPNAAFNLSYTLNAIAMPMIGGTMSWIGPLIGALLLGTVQQVANITIPSSLNLLLVGVLLVVFAILAPNGIIGLVRERRESR
jgi:branched-chain amino acid transport system permease protein